VTTIHGFSSDQILPVYQKYNENSHYVSISQADRHPSLKYAATIHHGIDLSTLPLATGPRDYLLFFGRIHPDKGVAQAIRAAKHSDLPLMIAGIIQDNDYFEEAVKPHINGTTVRFLGPVGSEKKAALLGGARALLHLINFDEPFGFSVVEAMACGTPVVTRDRGSMSELIREGENGIIVSESAPGVIPRDGQFVPAVVRASVEERFSHERMVDEYLSLYQSILLTRHTKQ
jgi:glycosyltransferase involved in cell wall biosynthesis